MAYSQITIIAKNFISVKISHLMVRTPCVYNVKSLCDCLYAFRSDIAGLKTYLLDLGATEVVTEEFCNSHRMNELVQVKHLSTFCPTTPCTGRGGPFQGVRLTKRGCPYNWGFDCL